MPLQPKEHRYRLDQNANLIENAVFSASAKSIGQHKKCNGYQGDDPQGAEEDIQCALKRHIENAAECGLVVWRQFHDKTDTLFLGGERIAEHTIDDPHHEKHE